MGEIAIRVEHLGKRYRIGERVNYKALRDTLTEALYAPFRAAASWPNGHRSSVAGSRADNVIWALKDLSFEVKQGEVVGIIGRNGAGKSTLLKILSRITKPTEGYARIYGRVGSLLEVGTGFHPELTGRENIYLNGAILGMKKAEIDRKFDEMVAFAEVERFIDTPVKYYSSGMYVRLAFAVAAHMETDILLVDEVLAVGDGAFQKKCLGKMNEIAHKGRTVLFVSHNMNTIVELCSLAILVQDGRIAANGQVRSVIDAYFARESSQALVELESLVHGGYQRFARLKRFALLNKDYKPATSFVMNEPIIAQIEVECDKFMSHAEIGFKVSSRFGSAIHYFTSTWEGLHCDLEPGLHCFEVLVPHLLVYPGRYQIGLWVLREGEWSDDSIEEVAFFDVVKGDVTDFSTRVERYAYSGCEVYAPSEWKTLKQFGEFSS
jgi:lipopolysaccharide transport system ATP-binding protein